jgi:hypothetical protein
MCDRRARPDRSRVRRRVCPRGTAVASIALLASLLLGCPGQRVKMYSGDAQAPDQLATLRGYFHRMGPMISLESIDGAPVPGQGPIRGGVYGRETEALITPGEHTVAFTVWAYRGAIGNSSGMLQLTFRAERGHAYEVRASPAPDRGESLWEKFERDLLDRAAWDVFIVDLQSEQPVQAQPGPQARATE